MKDYPEYGATWLFLMGEGEAGCLAGRARQTGWLAGLALAGMKHDVLNIYDTQKPRERYLRGASTPNIS